MRSQLLMCSLSPIIDDDHKKIMIQLSIILKLSYCNGSSGLKYNLTEVYMIGVSMNHTTVSYLLLVHMLILAHGLIITNIMSLALGIIDDIQMPNYQGSPSYVASSGGLSYLPISDCIFNFCGAFMYLTTLGNHQTKASSVLIFAPPLPLQS